MTAFYASAPTFVSVILLTSFLVSACTRAQKEATLTDNFRPLQPSDIVTKAMTAAGSINSIHQQRHTVTHDEQASEITEERIVVGSDHYSAFIFSKLRAEVLFCRGEFYRRAPTSTEWRRGGEQ
jgi:hypothetical protein